MALATYPRLSVKARLGLKNLLDSNDVFAELSDDAKNSCINIACQDISTFRNSLGKEDYWFSSDNNASVFGNLSIDNFDFLRKAIVVIDENGGAPLFALSQSTFSDLLPGLGGSFGGSGYDITLTSGSAEFDAGMFVIPSHLGQLFSYDSSSQISFNLATGFGRISFYLAVPKYTI